MKNEKASVERKDLTNSQKYSMEYYHSHHSNYRVKRKNNYVDIYCACGNDFSIEASPTNVKEYKCNNCGSSTII